MTLIPPPTPNLFFSGNSEYIPYITPTLMYVQVPVQSYFYSKQPVYFLTKQTFPYLAVETEVSQLASYIKLCLSFP